MKYFNSFKIIHEIGKQVSKDTIRIKFLKSFNKACIYNQQWFIQNVSIILLFLLFWALN